MTTLLSPSFSSEAAMAINDPHNHSTLASAADAIVDPLNNHSSIMHAMASIFVQEHDILACMSEAGDPSLFVTKDDHGDPSALDMKDRTDDVQEHGDGDPSLLIAKHDRTDNAMTYDKGVQMEDEHGTTYQMDVPEGKVNITTVANSASSDKTLGLKYGCCVPMPAGKNHWPSIMQSEDGEWCYLEK
jgi:hypothetical protein